MRIEDPVIRKAYNKMHADYQRGRYANDPDYKRRKIEANRKWMDRNRENWNIIQKERYKNKRGDKNAGME